MSEMTVNFSKCIQDSQDFGSDDEHMVSRVFFTLAIDGTSKGEFYADMKQSVGESFEEGSIEVGPPKTPDGSLHKGPFSQAKFVEAATTYYRSLVGSGGSGIHIGGGASNIRMRNNTFVQLYAVSFEVFDSAGQW